MIVATLTGECADVTFRLPDDTFGRVARYSSHAVWLGQPTRDAYSLRIGEVRLHLDAGEDCAEGGGFVLRRQADGLGLDGCVVERGGAP